MRNEATSRALLVIVVSGMLPSLRSRRLSLLVLSHLRCRNVDVLPTRGCGGGRSFKSSHPSVEKVYVP